MKLISLKAKNFKKLSDFSCDFQDGLNVIVGDNAQGKSTLLQAIESALFGITVVPGKKENIPTWGQTKFSLTLTFTNHVATSPEDDWYYCLTRTGSTAKLEKIGPGEETLLANGNTPVTKYIEELLGLTAKDFNLFVQSKQGETSGVLTFGATALNQKVEEFAGVSLIDAVQRKAQELATSSKARADALEVGEGDLVRAADLVTACAADQEDKALAAAGCATAVEQQQLMTAVQPLVASEELSRTQREAHRRQSALREAEAALAHAKESLTGAEATLAGLDDAVDVEQLEAVAKDQRDQLRTVQASINDKQALVSNGDRAKEELQLAVTALAACQKVSVEELATAQDVLDAHQDDVVRKAAVVSTLTAKLGDMQRLAKDAACPTCGTKLAEHDPVALAAEIESLKSQLATATAAHKDAKNNKTPEQAVTELLDKNRAAGVAEGLVAKWQAKQLPEGEHEALINELALLRDQFGVLGQSQAVTKVQLDAAEQTNQRHAAAVRNVATARRKLVSAEEAVVEQAALQIAAPTDVEIDTAAQAEADYRAAFSAWNQEKLRLAHALGLAESALTLANAVLANAEAAFTKLQEQAEDAKQSAISSSRATRLARFLRERRQAYLTEVWDVVMAASSRQVKVASGGMITRVCYDAGEFQFEEDGVTAPVTSASGAQKAHIGTAVRIGLARALYGSNGLLILDEPTESMSERHAAGLSASLVGAAKQTLLITHREQDQSLAANLIQLGA